MNEQAPRALLLALTSKRQSPCSSLIFDKVFPSTSAAVEGWYVTIGVDILKNWQAAVRYQEFNPNLDKSKDLVDVTTLGISYFIDPSHGSKNHGAKIQAAYSFNNVKRTTVNMPTGVLGDGDQFTLAFQVDF